MPRQCRKERTMGNFNSQPSWCMVTHLQSPGRAQRGWFPIAFLPTERWHCRNVGWLELTAIWTEIQIFYLRCLPAVAPQAKWVRVHRKYWRLTCNLLSTSEFFCEHLRREVFYSAPRPLFWCSYTFQLARCRTIFLNFLHMNSLEINIEVKPFWPFGFFLSFFLKLLFQTPSLLGKAPKSKSLFIWASILVGCRCVLSKSAHLMVTIST